MRSEEPDKEKEGNRVAKQIFPPGFIISERYVIERLLGSGGMGAVYLVADRVLGDERVALKVLHAQFTFDQRYTQRFLREVQLMRRVSHANIVRTFEVGTDGDIVYFTMEYAAGVSLLDLMEKRDLKAVELRDFIIQVCEGLQAIHDAGIIHRDMKPENIIFLPDGTVKITDFGVARPENSDLTAHNEVVGSSFYIAPEIWLGDPVTSATDLYSIGVVLYELSTGELPFAGKTPQAQMRCHLYQKPLPPRELDKNVPLWLNKLILHLLEKNPQSRPKSARAVIETLKQLHIDDYSNAEKTKPWSKRENEKNIPHLFLDQLEQKSQRLTQKSEARSPLPQGSKNGRFLAQNTQLTELESLISRSTSDSSQVKELKIVARDENLPVPRRLPNLLHHTLLALLGLIVLFILFTVFWHFDF